MLTSHRLPSIEKIKPVAYGDVGNKQTDRQLRHKDQASQTKKYKVRFEVLTAIIIMLVKSWVLASYRFIGGAGLAQAV
jgi:hypothetical protein